MVQEEMQIKALGERLGEHGVDKESAITISIMVDEADKRARLTEWIDSHPKASHQEILKAARKLAKEQSESTK